jgi:hypothetical protein
VLKHLLTADLSRLVPNKINDFVSFLEQFHFRVISVWNIEHGLLVNHGISETIPVPKCCDRSAAEGLSV